MLSGPVPGPKHGREVFVVEQGDDAVVDGFEDETLCLLRVEDGWAVLSGCCHRGLPNTLTAAEGLADGEPVVAVFGGLHLRNAGKDELRGAVERLKAAGSPAIYPCHCTGDEATKLLAKRLPGRVTPVAAGRRVVL
jgi:7,8-dihydropterin-6-yl-methyl-4-(beta-D-ribofuranosyl)aminobenzene 5'-phosphate synthase